MTGIMKVVSILVNFFEGCSALWAAAVCFAFMFEADNPDHSAGMGLFCLAVWLDMLLLPNIPIKKYGKFGKKETLLFQAAPFAAGLILFGVFNALY